MLRLEWWLIPCVVQTAMDSSQPGYVSCIIPRDISSDNGRVVLLEKGTRVLGEYQTGVQRGKYRLFAVWNREVTPRGVAIDVGSPAMIGTASCRERVCSSVKAPVVAVTLKKK